MNENHTPKSFNRPRPAAPVDSAAEWRSWLTGISNALLLYGAVSGLAIYLLPFSEFNQFSVLVHTVIGLLMVIPVVWFVASHWSARRAGRLSHYQLLGYVSAALLTMCIITGLLLTWSGFVGPAIDYTWDIIHLVTGIGVLSFVVVHLVMVTLRKIGNLQPKEIVRPAQQRFVLITTLGCALLIAVTAGASLIYQEPDLTQSFADDYNWRFGDDRPFAPSHARLDNSIWQESVQQQIRDAIGPDDYAIYRATFDKHQQSAVGAGLITLIKKSLHDASIKTADPSALERIFHSAIDSMKAGGAVQSRALAGSAGCGASGCHQQIYKEWLPSAHSYSSLDKLFQTVQSIMVTETAPEVTRYCAGCHDPISLLSGAKDSGNLTLSAEGSSEGTSCIVCHSIVQTDIQGNGDYRIRPPRRYVFEMQEGASARFISNFLIRTYPEQHIRSYSRPLYKTPEFCAACHKQYIDKEVNTDIGKVQGQNQYDSWKESRWHHEGEPEKTITCRECHMFLVSSTDPARGDASDFNRTLDDGKHRSHGMATSNQYIPLLLELEGAEQHVEQVEKWLRGEIEIPEIADRWTEGPVVRMEIVAPSSASPGEVIDLQVILTNNKTGHDFPTGPLDMIESWVEVVVTDGSDNVIYHAGGLDETGRIDRSPIVYKADGFDRKGELIDRHNLWDMVGASYKRTMYPGATDSAIMNFQCPSMARERLSQRPGAGERTEQFSIATPATAEAGQLTVRAMLWYRKANPDFLDRVYGRDPVVRSPVTQMSQAMAVIDIERDSVSQPR
ncbi:MAG: hypothetical protein IIB68_10365 [Proteobacteria bacterium]|nr:hypothetical protein [Pseudomonadota bacterium]